MASRNRALEFVCSYRTFWLFVLVFGAVQLLLLAVAFPVVEPGTAAYVVVQLDLAGVVFLLLLAGVAHLVCGYDIGIG